MSGIEWTDVTWNPVRGCSRVSAGCENCYAERQAHRFNAPGQPYHGLTNKHGAWNGQIMLLTEKLADPLRWQRPRRIFVNSMSDLFHDGAPDEYIDRVFAVMALAHRHTFQILTKRPERMRAYIERVTASATGIYADWPYLLDLQIPDIGKVYGPGRIRAVCEAPVSNVWPLPNVWLGVSVEDQATADERIPLLLGTPAAVRFVSYEPALDSVDLRRWMWPVHASWPMRFQSPEDAMAAGENVTYHRQALVLSACRFIDWLIVGGESGPGARPCDVQWIRSAVQQCRNSSVPVFVKQLGAKPSGWCRNVLLDDSGAVHYPRGFCDNYESNESGHCGDRCVFLAHRKGGNPAEWPEDLRVREWPAA